MSLCSHHNSRGSDILRLEDGEYDAAEIDREIISARLKEDVVSSLVELT